MAIRFPYSRPQLDETDIAAVADVLRGTFLTQGPQVAAFEAELGAYLGGVEISACANGTAALHLAYLAAGLGPERGLLTSPVTFLATANAARMCDAPVVFADVDPATGNLDPAAVRRVLQTTKVPVAAITCVHLGGRPCDMAGLRAVADEFGCLLIEDACHAPGATYLVDGVEYKAASCAHSDLAALSFHAIKHIVMGEGGAVACRRPEHTARVCLMRNHGLSRDAKDWQFAPEPNAPWYYEMAEVGWNYRLTDMQCALGRSQLRRLDGHNERRRDLAERYFERLAGIPHLTVPPRPSHRNGHAWHLFPVAIDFAALGKSRGQVMRELAEHGVGAQVHYIPLHHQPYYRDLAGEGLPGADAYYARTLSIPMYPALSDGDQDDVVAAFAVVLSQ